MVPGDVRRPGNFNSKGKAHADSSLARRNSDSPDSADFAAPVDSRGRTGQKALDYPCRAGGGSSRRLSRCRRLCGSVAALQSGDLLMECGRNPRSIRHDIVHPAHQPAR